MSIDSTTQRPEIDSVWADSVRSLPEYTYTESGPSLFDRFMRWLGELIMEITDGRADSVVDFVGYFVIIGIIVVIVMLVLRRGQSPVQISRRGHVRADDEELGEAEDIDRLIGTAVHDGRFRDAVRFLYLRSLADLRDAKIIEWQVDKTDSDYVRDVRGRWEHAEAFAAAVRHFQYVWYGEHAINEDGFATVREQFDALRRLT